MSRPSLTIFFPCYNDAGTIGSLVAAADTVATELTDDYEIIVVDDGSTDSSRELKLAQVEGGDLHESRDLTRLLEAATKEFVFYTDGDGQYDVFELRKLLPIMQEGVDVVNGYKIARSDPVYRVVIGGIYGWLMRQLFQFHVRDIDCDFRVIRREVFDTITLQHSTGVICLELVKKLELAGYRFVDFPVHHYHRRHGRSQFFRFGRLLRTGVNVTRLWWQLMVRRTTPVGVAHRDERATAH